MIEQEVIIESHCDAVDTQLLLAAAVLAGGSSAWPAALLDMVTDQPEAAGRLERAGLARHVADERYMLLPEAASQAQAILDDDPQGERKIHAAAAAWYATKLDYQAALEPIYMYHLARQCEMLIHQQPSDLAEVANAVVLELLHRPANRHLVRYYRALGAGLREEIGGARAQFAALLHEIDLDDTVRGRALNSSAIFARQQGDYEQALVGYRASQSIWERLGNQGRQGMALINQGILHYELQEYAAAEHELRAALPLLEAAGMAVYAGSAHNELGLLYRDQGRWDAAQSHFDTCISIWQDEGATEYLGFATINMGELALLKGLYAEAEERFRSALDLLGDDQAYAVEAHINLGLLAQAQGDHGAALLAYDRAQTLAVQVGYYEREALIHLRLGHVHEQLGHTTSAGTCYAAAVEAVEARRAPMRSEGLLISLMGRWQQVYEARLLHALAAGDLATAFAITERARARAFADMLARRGADDGPSADERRKTKDESLKSEALLHQEDTLLSHSAIHDPSFVFRPSSFVLLSYFAVGLRGPEQALLDRLPPEAAGLRACLDMPSRLVCFAVTADGLRFHNCLIDPNMLHSSSPRKADGRRFLQPAILHQLYDTLLGPVADLLTPTTSVAIAPHGPLHQLPFAALLDPTGTPLIAQVQRLAYTPSATVWGRTVGTREPRTENREPRTENRELRTENREPRTDDRRLPTANCQLPTTDSLLAIGYDGEDGLLRHTEAEARTVAAACGGVAWTGEAGVLERFVASAGDYRWLHLACHGTFDLNDPLRSALYIGPGEQLSAATVLERMHLRADLVTLSACRSGVSKVLRGDEPLGIVRAFLGAGARAVLVTQWPVEDTSARLLMERFYAELLAQGGASDPATALLVAQQSLRSLSHDALALKVRAWGIDAPPTLDCADPAIWAAYLVIEG